MSSIVLTGGGTAGHCIPHLAILPYIHEHFDNICYIGSENGIEKKLMSELCDYYPISTVKFKRSLTLSNLLIPFKLIKSVNEAKAILKKLQPNVIFSKGGYVSLPVVLAGAKLKIPIIAHESDYSIGLANRLTVKKCDKVLTSFPDTALSLKNGMYTGAPIRESLLYASKPKSLSKFGFDNGKSVVLVFGGSIGSQKINNALFQVLQKLLISFNVIHICGKGNLPSIQEKGYYVTEFSNNMSEIYSACDLVVSRCGSNSASELMALRKPTLFIPLGKSQSRGDQLENAEYYKSKGMCRVLLEENLNGDSLFESIVELNRKKDAIIKSINEHTLGVGNRKIANVLISYST